ncbi:probable inactive nicotinamidase At3g16190 isoform X2 [Nymphaea colorata]|nr:probable inactive nicotinamidase At3g16190 isoform X2 [Nymphaea colorata]
MAIKCPSVLLPNRCSPTYLCSRSIPSGLSLNLHKSLSLSHQRLGFGGKRSSPLSTAKRVSGGGSRWVMEGSKWKRTALLVVDMQNDFILPGGPMQVVGGAAVVPSVRKAVEIGRKRGALIIWVVREHDPFGRDVEVFRRHLYGDGKEKPVSKGSKGAELVEGLTIEEGDYKLVKTRFSAFFATHLDGLLKNAGITDLVVVGVQTPNCIRQTVFDAVALDYKSVTVIVDATAAATPEIHNANIFDMKNIGVATPTLLDWCGDDV